jgi:hypothetical protein
MSTGKTWLTKYDQSISIVILIIISYSLYLTKFNVSPQKRWGI